MVDAAIAACAKGDVARWAELPRGALAVARRRGCPTDPVTWMALEVRQQAREVPYWLLWHMALGVTRGGRVLRNCGVTRDAGTSLCTTTTTCA